MSNVGWWNPHDLDDPAVRQKVVDALGTVQPLLKAEWSDFHRNTDRIIDHYTPEVKAALAQVLSADTVTHAIRAAYSNPAELEKGVLDGFRLVLQSRQRLVDKLRAVLRALYTEAANEGAAEAAQAAGGDVPPNLSDILRQADIWIIELVDTQIDRIGETIAQGVAQGWPIGRTTDAVNAVVNDAKRAWLITETEYARAMTLAARATYKANNVAMVQWFEQPDACPRCQENFAVSPIPLTDSWPNGNVPVHPRCRCAEGPYIPVPGSRP